MMPGGNALFSTSSSGPGSTGGAKHLVEFRAGRMHLKGINNNQYSIFNY